jgi:signal transduction histidine kinase
MSAELSPEMEGALRKMAAAPAPAADAVMATHRGYIARLLAEVDRGRDEVARLNRLLQKEVDVAGQRNGRLLKELDKRDERIAELEAAGVEARAALASLCYDLEDPGTAALGALYLISQATRTVEAQSDCAEQALAKHDAQVIRHAAETLEGADRDDDAVNLLYTLADGTEKRADKVEAGERS